MKRKAYSNEKIVRLILIAAIVISFCSTILQNASRYTPDYWQRFPQLKERYLDSQYATKKPTRGWISDSTAYSYTGGALITGMNPVLVVPDAPPLGKYIIGLSAIIFNNEHILTAFFALLSVVLLYIVGLQVLHNKTLALIPSLFWSLEPLFRDQIIHGPLFDMFQLVFLLSMIYFFNKGYTTLKKKDYIISFILLFIFLGFFIATKYFVSGIIMIAAGIIVLLLRKKYLKLMYFISFIPISIGILLATFLRVFAFGYNIKEFLGIQKWIYLYHQSQFILPFSIWPLTLFNQWFVWFGEHPVIQDASWSITWPIITTLSFLTIILYLRKKIKHQQEIEILLSWTFFFFFFFSFGQVFPRYLIIAIPLMYIISIFTLREFISFNFNKSQKQK